MGLSLQNSSPDVPIQKDQITVHRLRWGNARGLDAALEFRDKLNIFGAQWDVGFHRCLKTPTTVGEIGNSLLSISRTGCARNSSTSRSWTRVCARINWCSIISLAPSVSHYLYVAVTRAIKSQMTFGTSPTKGSVPQVLADPSRAA